MNKSNQNQPSAEHKNKSVTKSNDDFTQIIHNVKVTLGYNPHNYFNLSILGNLRAFQVKKNGYYNKSKPILSPLKWVKSIDGQSYISKTCNSSENTIFASHYHTDNYPAIIYTRSFFVWIGYLKHSLGNIDTALSAELNN
jgi:hypothetical protein